MSMYDFAFSGLCSYKSTARTGATAAIDADLDNPDVATHMTKLPVTTLLTCLALAGNFARGSLGR